MDLNKFVNIFFGRTNIVKEKHTNKFLREKLVSHHHQSIFGKVFSVKYNGIMSGWFVTNSVLQTRSRRFPIRYYIRLIQ